MGSRSAMETAPHALLPVLRKGERLQSVGKWRACCQLAEGEAGAWRAVGDSGQRGAMARVECLSAGAPAGVAAGAPVGAPAVGDSAQRGALARVEFLSAGALAGVVVGDPAGASAVEGSVQRGAMARAF